MKQIKWIFNNIIEMDFKKSSIVARILQTCQSSLICRTWRRNKLLQSELYQMANQHVSS